jgi:hypothetical protein
LTIRLLLAGPTSAAFAPTAPDFQNAFGDPQPLPLPLPLKDVLP